MNLSTAVDALRAVATRIPKAADASKATAVDVRAALVVEDVTSVDADKLRSGMLSLFEAPEWQALAAGLLTASFLVDLKLGRQPPANTSASPEAWATAAAAVLTDAAQATLLSAVGSHLEDREPRVRTCVVSLLEALCRLQGPSAFEAVKDGIVASVLTNFERDGHEDAEPDPEEGEHAKAGDVDDDDDDDDAKSVGSACSTLSAKPTIAHDTVGWKALESSVRAFRAAVVGCGPRFAEAGHLSPQLLGDIIPRGSQHVNRFVREAVFFLCEAIVTHTPVAALEAVGFDDGLCALLAQGLGDNWSQVRYASSVATRAFTAATAATRTKFFPALVPRMCLNRYYVAEGVRLYSQETWKMVMGSAGPTVVASVIDEVVAYYLTQSDADNHAVREAACHCTAELAHKVDKTAVAPHVPALLSALVVCFKDESWPVRDAACLASGRFVRAFPEESRPQLEELYKLWFDHLWDNIWSVREDAAVALSNVLQAYGDEAFDRVLPKLDEMLEKGKSQPSDSKQFGDLTNATTFGVAKRVRDNDPALHTGNQVFSCGSLAPKLRKGGCMDHGFSRKREPWEATDGAVYLLREVAALRPDTAAPFLPKLAPALDWTHFTHAPTLQLTIWKQFPIICEHLGKKYTKRYLELFVEAMVRCLRSPSRLTAFAAGDCIVAMRRMIGPRIFAGRLTEEQQAEVSTSPFVSESRVPRAEPTSRPAPAVASAGAGAGAGSAAGMGVIPPGVFALRGSKPAATPPLPEAEVKPAARASSS